MLMSAIILELPVARHSNIPFPFRSRPPQRRSTGACEEDRERIGSTRAANAGQSTGTVQARLLMQDYMYNIQCGHRHRQAQCASVEGVVGGGGASTASVQVVDVIFCTEVNWAKHRKFNHLEYR